MWTGAEWPYVNLQKGARDPRRGSADPAAQRRAIGRPHHNMDLYIGILVGQVPTDNPVPTSIPERYNRRRAEKKVRGAV